MNKTFKILEIIWLAMGCIGVAACVYNIITKDNRGAIYFLVFTFVSGIMYSVRKRQRKKMEASQKQQAEKK